jgi:hypothetical protein
MNCHPFDKQQLVAVIYDIASLTALTAAAAESD